MLISMDKAYQALKTGEDLKYDTREIKVDDLPQIFENVFVEAECKGITNGELGDKHKEFLSAVIDGYPIRVFALEGSNGKIQEFLNNAEALYALKRFLQGLKFEYVGKSDIAKETEIMLHHLPVSIQRKIRNITIRVVLFSKVTSEADIEHLKKVIEYL